VWIPEREPETVHRSPDSLDTNGERAVMPIEVVTETSRASFIGYCRTGIEWGEGLAKRVLISKKEKMNNQRALTSMRTRIKV